MKPSYHLTSTTETPPGAKMLKSCTNLCVEPQTTTDATVTEIMVTAARWFVATPAAAVGSFEVTVDPGDPDAVLPADTPCATVDVRAKTITATCVESLASVLESVWLDVHKPDESCTCESPTAVCITEAPWGDDHRCVRIPDNTTTADQLCYGPCEHVAVMLGVATAVVAAAGGAAYTLRGEDAPTFTQDGI